MFELIKDFPAQLLTALEIGEKAALKNKAGKAYSNILVSGLGGSGIGGNLLAELLRDDLTIPVIVNKGYSLPAFVDESTLIILCSYSGNTEETVSVAKQVLAKGLKATCITSGGKLEQIANENLLDVIKIPGGFPPRACLGYSFVQLLFVLHYNGLIDDSFKQKVKQTAALLSSEQEAIIAEYEAMASKIAGKILIAYAEDKYESVALRFKQQVNENGKMHCWYNVVPEMNHNELVGWRVSNDKLAVIIFRTLEEYKRNGARLEFSKEVISKRTGDVFEIHAKGANAFEKHFYLIHLGDWLTYYLAKAGGYDAMEIDVLNTLKAHMGSIVS
jgi:glucose/mannose-6-phosphate isomerase